MTKYRLLFIVICSIFQGASAFGQNVEQLIHFADLKYEQAQYNLAAKEYQRALFFGTKDKVGPLNVSTGDCFFEMGDYTKAEKYYRFAFSLMKNDSIKSEVMLKKASCQLLNHQNQMAIFDLFNVNEKGNKTIKKKKYSLLGIAYFGLNDFDRSEEHFLVALSENSRKDINQLIGYFDSKKLHRPNPKLAYWLSVVLPGSGQFYSGDFKNGLNSLILSTGLAIMTYEMALSKSIIDALFTVFPWWQRYYMGGYNSAKHIAEVKRQENRAKMYSLIYSIVME